MKKNLSFLFALVFAGLAISSCEDVPAPYDVPGSGSDTTVVTNDSIYLQETFASKFGDFTVVTEEGTPWVNKYSCATATGYDNTTKTTTASKSWLISKPIDLTKSNGAYVSFDYILRYVSAAASNKVLVSTDYAGDPTKATWTDITGTLTEGKDYTTFASYKTNLPTSVIGKSSVVIAFYYSCTTNSSTWEVKNLLVKEGKADETTPVTPVQPSGTNLLSNGTFETWSNGVPDGWKSASTASSATLSQSTTSHGGSYSVLVSGSTTANKRLASIEMTLKSGTYLFSGYFRGATESAEFHLGYVPVTSGTVGSYVYETSYHDAPAGTWTQGSYSFTLTEETTVCLIVMNPKSPGKDLLVDDLSLTTNDGGVVNNGGNVTPPSTTYTYEKVTTITSGGKYILGALVDGTYFVASPLASSSTYGYLTAASATLSGNSITLSTDNSFVITSTDKGYTIADATTSRYLFMKGTYNSFNVDAAPTEGQYWDITPTSDGLFTITNKAMSKWIQYSTQYKSYGAYNSEKGVKPALFKLK
jgi:hypothetical protein